jgi:alkylation response protein AidB-like acyl-CoA dehydrogenase
MDFELTSEEREGARRAAGIAARAGSPGGDPAALRQGLLAAQQALAGGAGGVAAGLALARESAALFLGVEATRHLASVVSALGGGLPPGEAGALSRGERVGAVALADDAGAPARLVRAGAGWRLTGRKSFATNAPAADWIGAFAEAEGGEALCLLSPRDPGVRVGAPMDLMGLDGLLVSEVAAEGAALAPARVLGPFEDRAASARYARDADLSLAVAAAGLMRGAVAAANRQAHERQRGGRPLYARQEVAFRLAEVLALTEAAELLCHRAAWLVRTGGPEADTVVRCAKVFCTESAERAAGAALQVWGGQGYRKGNAGERAWRDAKGLALAGTTAEVARMAIADAALSRARGA